MIDIQEPSLCPCDNETGFLDILITLAESWRILLFGPLVSGAFVGALSFLWPPTFESVAILRLAEDDAALLHMAPVLDPIITQFGLLAEAGGNIDDARQGLKNRLTYAFDKKNKVTTITAKASEPKQAQDIVNATIVVLLKELQVKGQNRALIEKSILVNDEAIDVSKDAIASLLRGIKRNSLSEQMLESSLKNLTAINSDLVKRKLDNEVLRQQLEVRGAEIFLQAPSLPQQKISPKRSAVLLTALMVSGVALLLFVFIRKAWQKALLDTVTSVKIDRLRRELGLSSLRSDA